MSETSITTIVFKEKPSKATLDAISDMLVDRLGFLEENTITNSQMERLRNMYAIESYDENKMQYHLGIDNDNALTFESSACNVKDCIFFVGRNTPFFYWDKINRKANVAEIVVWLLCLYNHNLIKHVYYYKASDIGSSEKIYPLTYQDIHNMIDDYVSLGMNEDSKFYV